MAERKLQAGGGVHPMMLSAAAPIRPRRAAAEVRRLAGLDAVRAIAALSVLALHSAQLLPAAQRTDPNLFYALRSFLWTGVDLFFAVSGLLIAGPFLRALLDGRPVPMLRSYLLRRVARIVPAYWIALAALLLLAPQPGTSPFGVLAHILLVHGWVAGQGTAVYTVAWTLGIEAGFYLLVPVATLLIRAAVGPRPIRPAWLATGIVLAGAASLAIGYGAAAATTVNTCGTWCQVASGNLPDSFVSFCPGMLVAILLAARPGRFIGARLAVPVAIAVWFCALPLTLDSSPRQLLVRNLLLAIGSGLFVLGFVDATGVVARVGRWLAPLGVISYGLYLWHWVVVRTLGVHGLEVRASSEPVGWLASTALVLAPTVLLAWASWVLVERPLIALAARYRRRFAVAPTRRDGAPAHALVDGEELARAG